MRPLALLVLLALFASPCVIVLACIRSANEGGWGQVGRIALVIAATAFLAWFVGDMRLRSWQSQQGMHNRMNVCMIDDNLTALLDVGDEKLARGYVGFFGTNGCTLLDFEQMQTARGKELQEKNLDWYTRIQDLKGKAKGK